MNEIRKKTLVGHGRFIRSSALFGKEGEQRYTDEEGATRF